MTQTSGKSRWLAVFLAVFLGGFGAHKFYLGVHRVGIIYFLITVLGSLLLGWGAVLVGMFCIVDVINYVLCSDEDFERTYAIGKREWF